MARASVVVVSYNARAYLGEAIDSALGQGDTVEVVVVDDGSTDGSAEVVLAYGARVVPVVRPNGGQAAAMSAGFAASGGDVVLFLDGDDLLLPGTIAAALARFEAEPYAKMHWPLVEVDGAGRPLGGVNPPAPLPAGDLSELVLARGPGAYPVPPSSGNAYSRDFLSRVMPIPAELRVCADGYLYDLAPLYGPVARLDRPGGAIRFHDDSAFMSRRYDERLPHSVRVHERAIAAMARRCREMGRAADEAGWADRSWPIRSQRALADVARVVPASTPFVLVDGGRLGVEPTQTLRFLALPEVPGPAHALRALDGLGPAGRVLVVAWPSFGWMDATPGVRAVIERSYLPRLENDRVRVYQRA